MQAFNNEHEGLRDENNVAGLIRDKLMGILKNLYDSYLLAKVDS